MFEDTNLCKVNGKNAILPLRQIEFHAILPNIPSFLQSENIL